MATAVENRGAAFDDGASTELESLADAGIIRPTILPPLAYDARYADSTEEEAAEESAESCSSSSSAPRAKRQSPKRVRARPWRAEEDGNLLHIVRVGSCGAVDAVRPGKQAGGRASTRYWVSVAQNLASSSPPARDPASCYDRWVQLDPRAAVAAAEESSDGEEEEGSGGGEGGGGEGGGGHGGKWTSEEEAAFRRLMESPRFRDPPKGAAGSLYMSGAKSKLESATGPLLAQFEFWRRVAEALGTGRSPQSLNHTWVRRIAEESSASSIADDNTSESEESAEPTEGHRRHRRLWEPAEDALLLSVLGSGKHGALCEKAPVSSATGSANLRTKFGRRVFRSRRTARKFWRAVSKDLARKFPPQRKAHAVWYRYHHGGEDDDKLGGRTRGRE